MEEKKQSQGALCKEAAAKAAVAVEQTKILLQIASIQKKTGWNREGKGRAEELAEKYRDQLYPRASQKCGRQYGTSHTVRHSG